MYAYLGMEFRYDKLYHRKKALKLCEKRRIIEDFRDERPKDIGSACPDKSGACRVLRIRRSSLHYRYVKDDSTIISHLEKLAEDHSILRFWIYYHPLRN